MRKTHIHGGDIYSYPDIIDFSANCNPFGTPKGVIEAAEEALKEICYYPDVQCRELRTALADAEKVPYDSIICGNGAADLIFSIALTKKPKKALLPAPTFAEYEQALAAVGCRIEYYYLKEKQGFVPNEDLLLQITEETDLVFFCNPNNPTGVLSGMDYIEKLADKCKASGTFLVLDECFTDFLDQPEKYTFKKHLKDYPNVFLVKAFTKKYAMAGIRLGYGLCNNVEFLSEMRAVMQPWNVSGVAQKAGVAALKELTYVADTMKKIQIERVFLQDKLKEMGLQLYDSKANYIFFKGPKMLREKCLKMGISIRDCSNYEGLEAGFYRVAVRTRSENEKLVEVLHKILG